MITNVGEFPLPDVGWIREFQVCFNNKGCMKLLAIARGAVRRVYVGYLGKEWPLSFLKNRIIPMTNIIEIGVAVQPFFVR